MQYWVRSSLILALLAPSRPALGQGAEKAQVPGHAAEEAKDEPFGKAGVLNIASDLSLFFQYTSYSAPNGETAPDSTTTYLIGPAADYFIINNLSIGALVQFGHILERGDAEAKSDVIRLAPRIGYHLPLVPERLGLWPRAEFSYSSLKVTIDATATTSGLQATEKRMSIGLFVPLLMHPVEHFHIGIGPFIDTDLSSKVADADAIKETTIGLRTEIAGWWKL